MLSSFVSNLRKQTLAIQSIVATIPLVIYFRDEFYSITHVKGTSMEPTIRHGDMLLVRKRDAGSVVLNILYSIGYLKSSSSSSSASVSSGNTNNRAEVKEEDKSSTRSTRLPSGYDDDRIQALRYRLENTNDSTSSTSNAQYWLISPSYLRPLILPGHVVVYQNPYRFQESVVNRVVGVGGQRIATRTTKKSSTLQLTNDIVSNLPVVKGENTSLRTPPINENDTVATSPTTSDNPSLLQHLRHKQQLRKEMDEYYDVRLSPHYLHTEGDNDTSLSGDDDSYLEQKQPISQNLMIGIAEYIIWPPSRFQRIVRQPVYETINNHNHNYSISRPRAIWD